METLKLINCIIAIIFIVCYSYQLIYIPVPWIKKEKPHKTCRNYRYAILICARNEEKVVAHLIDSIKQQTYRSDLISVFVMADNCTDNTAAAAKEAGAVVYERSSKDRIGKGYALDALISHIHRDYNWVGFDAFFIFDADNLLDGNYILEMNKTFSDGYEIIAGYRNSKNYGDNWISAGYALWFLRDSIYLNQARMLLGTSCAVSGTGFLFSTNVINDMGGWPFHLLTEDMEFTVDNVLKGRKIGFCKNAVLYDEQPVTFRQSWHQRMRWSKGYLQVFGKYGKELIKGMLMPDFSCFDMTMAVMPAIMLTVTGILVNTILAISGAIQGEDVLIALKPAGQTLLNAYLLLYFLGVITTVTQWRSIHTSAFKKILYTFTFPLFMFTYIPISFSSLFAKAEWKPIEHNVSITISDYEKKCGWQKKRT